MAKDEKKAGKEKEKEEEKEEKDSAGEGTEGEGVEAGEAEEGGEKKLSKKMLIILAVAGVLVLGGGTAGALFLTGVLGGEKKEAQHEDAGPKSAAVFFSLGDILVNLNGEGKRPNFLKIKVTLELADEKDLPLMQSLKPRIIDNFQVYLRELRIEDLRGSAGLYRLREELLLRVTEAAQPVRVRDVLFQEILVQ
ncbi:MAG: flagellar basal body-associated FliL family protein [Alphaproteobacteria bacterium]|nr:flagellar basal body-associated FliL family protein [Alphaproteobacteria bacterium]